MPTLLEVSLSAALLAALVYFILALVNQKKLDLRTAIECLLNGSGVPGGFFLMACAFVPDWLCRVVNNAGLPVVMPGLHLEVEGEKRLAILVGGFAIEFLAVASLLSTYAKQKRAKPGYRPSKKDAS